jgi:hypothetical protein
LLRGRASAALQTPWERELLGSGKRRRLSRWRYRIDTIVDLLVKRTHLKRVEAHDL